MKHVSFGEKYDFCCRVPTAQESQKHLPHRVAGIILLHVNREAHNDNVDYLEKKVMVNP
jgi:hypothetical protein